MCLIEYRGEWSGLFSRCLAFFKKDRSGSQSLHIKFIINNCNAPAPLKHVLSDASALVPLLHSTLIWLSKQTKNGVDPLYYTLQPKKWNGSVMLTKHRIELLQSEKTRIEPLHSSWLSDQTHSKFLSRQYTEGEKVFGLHEHPYHWNPSHFFRRLGACMFQLFLEEHFWESGCEKNLVVRRIRVLWWLRAEEDE
jgi:hypothetical protein